MILAIKKRFFIWYIYDNKKDVVLKIKSKRFLGPAKKIIDSNNMIVYTTDIINKFEFSDNQNNSKSRKYVLYKSGIPFVVASLIFASESSIMALRPPRVDEMLIETPYGLVHARRQKDNGIIFYQNEQQICKISPFFRFRQHVMDFNVEYDAAFFAGLYVFAEYMMHEDDIITV